MQIEMGKKYQTMDGRDVRILCVDGPTFATRVVGIVDCGGEYPIYWTHTWTSGGISGTGNSATDDLTPTLTKREGWSAMRMKSVTPETVCIADGVVFVSESEARKYADEMLTDGYIISHVTWKE